MFKGMDVEKEVCIYATCHRKDVEIRMNCPTVYVFNGDNKIFIGTESNDFSDEMEEVDDEG